MTYEQIPTSGGNTMDIQSALEPNVRYEVVLANVEERGILFDGETEERQVAMCDLYASVDGVSFFPASAGARPILRCLGLGASQDQENAITQRVRYVVSYRMQTNNGTQRRVYTRHEALVEEG